MKNYKRSQLSQKSSPVATVRASLQQVAANCGVPCWYQLTPFQLEVAIASQQLFEAKNYAKA